MPKLPRYYNSSKLVEFYYFVVFQCYQHLIFCVRSLKYGYSTLMMMLFKIYFCIEMQMDCSNFLGCYVKNLVVPMLNIFGV
jgi:hypothetical protein